MHLASRSARTVLALVLLLGRGATARVARPTTPAHDRRPNLVFILSDDEDVALHGFMPKTTALIAGHGVTLRNFFVTSPLCCPSRASFLRGQYPHNTGIRTNDPPTGGFVRFFRDGLDRSTLATWLQAAGYQTIFAGKYLNHYGDQSWSRTYVPPGWSDWLAGFSHGYRAFGYALNDNGTIVRHGHEPDDYLTDVLAERAAKSVRSAAAARKPFFLYVAPFSPHQPATPAPRHANRFLEAPLARALAFDEADMSDKPPFLAGLSALSADAIAAMTAQYRNRLQALQAVDDLVETVVRTLQEVGQLDHTVIVYTSDNGYHLGAHRLAPGKSMPYEEDIRVPFVVRGPGIAAGVTRDQPALNIDLAPTFARLAGVEPPEFVDGRSLLPILGTDKPPAAWRQSFVVERGGQSARLDVEDEAERLPGFTALRASSSLYVEWGDGSRELYDLTADPGELTNRFTATSPAHHAALAERTKKLGHCTGSTCRTLEDLPSP